MSEERWRFGKGDPVFICSYVGVVIYGHVISRYVPTKDEHPAGPHNRYVVLSAERNKTHDVSERELSKACEPSAD